MYQPRETSNDSHTYRIVEQRRIMRVYTHAKTHQSLRCTITGIKSYMVSFLEKLSSIAWRNRVIKEELYSVLILHLLKPLFSVFSVLQALRIFLVLVNEWEIGDPLEAAENMHMVLKTTFIT